MRIKGGAEADFQVDTGATCDVLKLSAIKGTKYEGHHANQSSPQDVQCLYLRPLGKCKVQLTNPVDKRKFIVTFTIVEDERCVNLIGSRIAQHLQLITVRNDKIQSPCLEAAEHAPTADINVASNQMFRGLQLEVDKDVRPVQQPLRRVPEAMRKPLKEYLDELEAKGILEKVERPTEWVNSMVIARNTNGKLRLFLDPKPLNKALKRCHFPMPVIEDILPEFGKAKIFTKVDCKDGYWQIKLMEESSLLTAFATPFGKYKWNRMPFGISPASEIFQLRLHEAVEGLDGVYTIADDILVAGAVGTM
ncbi:Uncharacterized protein K02A2.6 [Stylophora pistillata]|uniref:Uncharacterized protein K02A2.6 n=1 Tax=Stylophora pistillata TaxID=50429 RepID=A0A2B4RD79_STYPI|nr:Uncharacterized protein K02A2.6 [Stylophora pistillata]